jgi:RNA polymerase sigma-70 factor, ECF subfamily
MRRPPRRFPSAGSGQPSHINRVGAAQKVTRRGLQRKRGTDTLINMAIAGLSEEGAPQLGALSDAEVVQRVRSGDRASFEILMRRHNQRIYRAARAILRDESDVEDVMQQAYINAFTHLDQFEERSRFSTWLTRIAVNEALARRQKLRSSSSMAATFDLGDSVEQTVTSELPTPEHLAYAGELQRVLEVAVDDLPDMYRAVFMLRDIEGLSTNETSEALDLGEEAVKTRLHRARAMVRRAVASRLGEAVPGAFQFQAPRCDRVVAFVFERLSVREAV